MKACNSKTSPQKESFREKLDRRTNMSYYNHMQTTNSNNSGNQAEAKMVSVQVAIDTDAALLRGEVSDSTGVVLINPAELSLEERKELIKLKGPNGFVVREKLEFASPEALKAFLTKMVSEEIARVARLEKAKQDQQAKEDAAFSKFEKEVAECLATPPTTKVIGVNQDGKLCIEHGFKVEVLDNLKTPYRPSCSPDRLTELEAKLKQAQQAIEASNASKIAALMPEITKYWDDLKATWKAEQAARAAAREAAEAQAAAKALASGVYSVTWGEYNGRRMGRPWAAKVSLINGKLDYAFVGNYAGNDDGGLLTVPCVPGEIIGVGQKDYRGDSMNVLKIMMEDGSVTSISKADAVRILTPTERAANAPKLERNDIAELKRRLGLAQEMVTPTTAQALEALSDD
jgi:hypothetical protein